MHHNSPSKTLHDIFSVLDTITPTSSDVALIEVSLTLSEALLKNAPLEMSPQEVSYHQKFNRLLKDQVGKAFFHTLADQCFRTSNSKRSIDQYTYLLSLYGMPTSLAGMDRAKFLSINSLTKKLPGMSKKMLYNYLLKHAQPFFLSAHELSGKSISTAGLALNIDCYCSAAMGEKDVQDHLNFYTYFAKRDDLSQLTINTESLLVHRTPFDLEKGVEAFLAQAKSLLKAYLKQETRPKPDTLFFIEPHFYSHDALALKAFIKLAEDPEFLSLPLGVVLHAYFPDSYTSAARVLDSAKKRRAAGGAPLTVTLSKGKFLKKESQIASSDFHPQPCFLKRQLTDANFKKILKLLIKKESISYCHTQVFTHNLLDIAYALALKTREGIKHGLSFEMVQNLSSPLKKTLVHMGEKTVERKTYVPRRYEKQAIITLYRKISDQSNPYSFICSTCGSNPEESGWQDQVRRFEESIQIEALNHEPRMLHAKREDPFNPMFPFHQLIKCELPAHQTLIEEATKSPSWDVVELPYIQGESLSKENPHQSGAPLYTFTLPKSSDLPTLLEPLSTKSELLVRQCYEPLAAKLESVLEHLKQAQTKLIQALIYDLAMPFHLANQEISAAIDFAQYALNTISPMLSNRDIEFTSKGLIAISPHPYTPLSTLSSALFGSLLCGNRVVVAAPTSCVQTLFLFTQFFMQAGFSQEQLLFVPSDETVLNTIASSPLIDEMHYFGYRDQARQLYTKRGMTGFKAELEGKNTMIVTAMSDRDSAIKHVIDSAFQFNGCHPFSISVLILEKEVYQDPIFKERLVEAAKALEVGAAHTPSSAITPLMQPLNPLQEEMLESEEIEWLLKPQKVSEQSLLYSPGIAWNVKRGSMLHTCPLGIPVLGVMCAENLDQAIYLANNTPFGLAASMESLDIREHKQWLNQIKAGSRFINIPTTHLRVKKHPICAIKGSIFGPSRSRGGPNALIPFVNLTQEGIPKEKFPINQKVNNLTRLLDKITLSAEDLGIWYASIASYAFFFGQFKRDRDQVKVIGEDHTLSYRPRKKLVLRINPDDLPIDFLRILAATLTAHVPIEVSWEKSPDLVEKQIDWNGLLPNCTLVEEKFDAFLNRVKSSHFQIIRTISEPSQRLKEALAGTPTFIESGTPFSNGRFELLRYFHEIATSSTYHRFGNLGLREGEIRNANY